MRSVAVAVGQGTATRIFILEGTVEMTQRVFGRALRTTETDHVRHGRRPPADSFVLCCPSHTNPRLCMGKGRRSRPFALSIPRVLLAEGRRGHGNATAVRSQSEPAADEDRRAANNAFCVCGGARPRGALPLCRRTRSPPGRSPPTRLVLPARLAPCRCRARRADRASGGGEPRIGAASQGAPARANGGGGMRGDWARDQRPSRRSVLAGEMADRHHGHCPRTPQAHWVAGKVPQGGPRVPLWSWGAGRATGASSGLFRFSDVFS